MRLDVFFVVFIIVWVGLLLPSAYWQMVTLDVVHTYVLPSASCSGRLTSNRWDFQTIREGLLFCMYFIFPWTLAFMMFTRERIGWIVHVLVAIIAVTWLGTNVILDISDLDVANVPPDHPGFKFVNYARSPDYCILYGGQPGTSLLCSNTAPCSGVGVLTENLKPSWPFLIRFVLNIFYTFLLILIMFYSVTQWQYGIKKKN